MLESAEEHEQELRHEWLKYDPKKTEDFYDSEKQARSEKLGLAVGMYYAASFSYYFMAMEGFVNLISLVSGLDRYKMQ